MVNIIEKVVGDFGDKRRWRQYKERVKGFPEPYRTATQGVERYLQYFGGITKADVLMTMLEDLADLFEQSAADGRPIRTIVGDDPVAFAEALLANYSEGQWINKERQRLITAIEQAETQERTTPS